MSAKAIPCDVRAQPVGRVPARLEIRAADDRAYLVDCQPLLREHELVVAVTDARAPGLIIKWARAREGLLAEIHMVGDAVTTGAAHADHELRFTIKTTHGVLGVCLPVRVHLA